MQNPNLTKQSLQVVQKILSKNDRKAQELREFYKQDHIYVINLMSSAGSGKTTLLEQMATLNSISFAVVEGDLQTNRDATRLESKGVSAHQILTGEACHLEASMVEQAYHALKDRGALEYVEYMFIENVGNLVCPASYDLGAHLNMVLLSTPEGDDKVLKYPTMFLCADVVLISKADLCEVFDFSIDRVKEDLAQLRANIPIFLTSARDPLSIQKVIDFIVDSKKAGYHSARFLKNP